MPTPAGKCLFITRQFFDPPHSGAFIYSSQFARALCEFSDNVVVFTHSNDAYTSEQDLRKLQGYPANMQVVLGCLSSSGKLRQQLSSLPAIAARFSTTQSRTALRDIIARTQFDVAIIDSIASAWAVPLVRQAKIPSVIYLAHNDEYQTKLNVARSPETTVVAGWAHHIDAMKLRWVEDELLRISRAVCCISDEDRRPFARRVPKTNIVSCPAGYSGPVVSSRSIDTRSPRRICLLGSFIWGAKRQNLKAFLNAGYRNFMDAGVEVVIVGNMEDSFRKEAVKTWPGVVFTGRVEDVAPYLEPARIGVIPEEIGGGFKLKIFDYVFRRVPVYALREAMSQVPLVHGESVMLFDTMDALCSGMVAAIDDAELLNRLHCGAIDACGDYLGLSGIRKGLQQIFQNCASDPLHDMFGN